MVLLPATFCIPWRYKQHRVMAWLGPAYNSSSNPFAPEIRHWKSGALMHTVPIPGIHFFDAWRIRPSLRPDPLMGAQLPSMGKEELIPQEPPNADYGQNDKADVQHRREQEREARVSTKTMARLALEMSHVHRLAALVTDKADLLKALTIQRQSYQDELKEASKGKSTAKAAAPKKQKTTDAPSADSLTQQPIPEPTAHGSQAMEVDQSNLTPPSTGTPFPYPFTSAPQYGRKASSSSHPLPPLHRIHRLIHKTRPRRLFSEESNKLPPRSRASFVTKFSRCFPICQMTGH